MICFCVQLADCTNLLKLIKLFELYTSTVCKNCNYVIPRLDTWRHQRAVCSTYMTSVTHIRQVKCMNMFIHLSLEVEAAYTCLKQSPGVPYVAPAHVVRFSGFSSQSRINSSTSFVRTDLNLQVTHNLIWQTSYGDLLDVHVEFLN